MTEDIKGYLIFMENSGMSQEEMKAYTDHVDKSRSMGMEICAFLKPFVSDY